MAEIKNYKPISAEWISSLSEFNTFLTQTFKGGRTSLSNAIQRVTDFYKKQLPDATFFIAFEPHASGLGYHAHAMANIPDTRIKLLTPQIKPDGKPLYCRRLWAKAIRSMGRNTISEIKNYNHVVNYAQKRVFDYQSKEKEAVFKILFGNSPECRADYLRCKNGDCVAYPTS